MHKFIDPSYVGPSMPRKIQPMELDLWFTLSDGTNYIDIAQGLSMINRKTLRQGMQYAVQDITLFASSGAVGGGPATSCIIERLPHSWPMVNAWNKGFKIWEEMDDQVLDVEPSIAGKWRDFKVFFDSTHANQSHQMNTNLLPTGSLPSGAVNTTPDELGNLDGTVEYDWNASQIVIPNDPDAAAPGPGVYGEYFLHVLGPDNGTKSKSLIHGYALSRSRVTSPDPNTPANTGWMVELFDVGDNLAEIEANVRQHNNEPPYLINADSGSGDEYYPGGKHLPDAFNVADLTASKYQTQKSSGSFLANCGLIKITNSNTDDDALLRVRVSAGPYKGVMARPMQEVN